MMNMKYSTVVALVAVLLGLAGSARSQQVDPQTCNAPMNGLSVCAPYIVPGAPAGAAPTADCCAAFGAVPTDCLCSALRIASRLPTQCNLPPISCPIN